MYGSYSEQPPPGVQQHNLPPPPPLPPPPSQLPQTLPPTFVQQPPPEQEQQQQQQAFQPPPLQQQYPPFPPQPQPQPFAYPSYAPLPLPLPPDGASHKRPREAIDDADDADSDDPSKRLAATPDVVFRVLVPPSLTGKVIGRHGSHIKQIRDETGARIRIVEPLYPTQLPQNLEERVVLITSKDEVGTYQCPAERCLIQLVTLLIEPEAMDRAFPGVPGSQSHRGSSLIRILITESQAGGVIGRGGSVIKEIREMSGANIRVLPRDHLPICATASETDRLVQISGEFSQLRRGVELIAAKIRENPPKEVISTQPNFYFATSTLQPQMLLPQAGYSFPSNESDPAALAAYGTMMSQPCVVGGYGGPIAVIPKAKAEMRVPSVLIGGVIGKGGANISQIRSLSGASIKVSDQKEGALERIIYFTGTSEQISTAQSLVQAFVDAQQQLTTTFVQ